VRPKGKQGGRGEGSRAEKGKVESRESTAKKEDIFDVSREKGDLKVEPAGRRRGKIQGQRLQAKREIPCATNRFSPRANYAKKKTGLAGMSRKATAAREGRLGTTPTISKGKRARGKGRVSTYGHPRANLPLGKGVPNPVGCSKKEEGGYPLFILPHSPVTELYQAQRNPLEITIGDQKGGISRRPTIC